MWELWGINATFAFGSSLLDADSEVWAFLGGPNDAPVSSSGLLIKLMQMV